MGLQSARIALDFTSASPVPPPGTLLFDYDELEEVVVELNDEEGMPIADAVYLVGADGVVTNPAEPAIPLVTLNVTAEQTLSLRGVGFTGGAWREEQVLPLSGAPATELRGVHTPFTSPVNFPMRLATVNYYDALLGSGTTVLHVTPTQHRDTNVVDIFATRRQFDSMDYKLYYSSNTDQFGHNIPALSGPPTLSGVEYVVESSGNISVSTHVVGDPAAGMAEAWVTFTVYKSGFDASGSWVSVPLVQDATDTTLWTGVIPDPFTATGELAPDTLDFVVQAASGTGLVTLDDNFGSYYRVSSSGESAPIEPADTQMTITVDADGNYGTEAVIVATLTSGDSPVEDVAEVPILFTIGGTGRAAVTNASGVASIDLPLTSPPGVYPATASFGGNAYYNESSAESSITITRTATSLSLTTGEQVVGVEGIGSGVSALLTDAQDAPLLQRTVYFTLRNGPVDLVTIAVITDNTGVATLGELPLPAGNYDLEVRFLGEIPTGDPSAPLILADPTYFGTVEIIPGFVLNHDGNCPSELYEGLSKKSKKSSKTSKSKKLNLKGFCYLTADVNGDVKIKDGTLIVGEGATVAGKIDQQREGGVHVLASATVEKDVHEKHEGDVIVDGVVNGKLHEHDAGKMVVGDGAVVAGEAKEHEDGSLIISGLVGKKADEKGDGDLVISATGRVEGHAHEHDAGTIINDGTVLGHISEHAEKSMKSMK